MKETVNRVKAKQFFDEILGESTPIFKVSIKMDKLLKDYILHGILPSALIPEETVNLDFTA
ncbi:hypothetical protein [Arcanobacterium hippocoleae]|uniref:Uncharacterized protein n=1 Tax=Arcanobacterium hippocoleae TaxID=149017 RepID=A0ABU1T3G5_9ACTO|nr:hypothetical protein [Arcanobacterium hippocoleae]MDR6939918.1 hypothetical protein [Arcanobacterium hippocoleae]